MTITTIIIVKAMAQQIGTTLDKAQQIGTTLDKALEIGLKGFIGIVHGARSVYDNLSSSETGSNTVQTPPIRSSKSSPTSITHPVSITRPDGEWVLIDEFNAPDAPDIELLEEFNAPDVSSESSDAPGIDLEIQWCNTSVTIDRSGNIFDSHGRKLEKDAWENGRILPDKNGSILPDK